MARPVKIVTEQGDEVPQDVDLDLDALEAEAQQKPFRFRLGGEVFTMYGPDDVDWRVQLALDTDDLGSMKAFIKELLGADENVFERFEAKRLTGGKLSRLIKDCYAHYGVSAPESQASQGLSKPTARR